MVDNVLPGTVSPYCVGCGRRVHLHEMSYTRQYLDENGRVVSILEACEDCGVIALDEHEARMNAANKQEQPRNG